MKSYTQTIIFEISNTANILGSVTLPVLKRGFSHIKLIYSYLDGLKNVNIFDFSS